MDKAVKQKLVEHLYSFITPERMERFKAALNNRTRHVTVALEDIYQPQNASAVLRTCDCFGIQDVHIIENRNKYEINPDVELGAAQWLTLSKYNKKENNSQDCLLQLKEKGYKVYATSPHADSMTLEQIPLQEKAAIVFGTELAGISEEVKTHADELVRINMYGFTESFNISVSAAIVMHNISSRLRHENIRWQLQEEEALDLELKWLRRSIKKCDLIEKQFISLGS